MSSYNQVTVATSTAGSILLHRLAPEYLLFHSTWKTAAILFLSQALAYYFYNHIVYPLYLSPLLKLPSVPGGNPIFGHFLRIIRQPTGEPLKEWASTIPNDGLIHYRGLFNNPRVMCTNPKSLAEVLTQKPYDFVKPALVRAELGRILGEGVLLAEGDEHKRQRKHLTPAFAFRHVKDLYPVFWDKATEMVLAMNQAISEPAEGSEKPSNVIEVGGWTSRAALDIIGVAGMGRDFNAIKAPTNELFQTYQRIFRRTRTSDILGLMSFILPNWLVSAVPVKRNDELNEAARTVKRVAFDLIQEKKVKLAEGKASGVDILSVALQSGGFSDEDLVNQLMTFLAAGHETTASTMIWAVYQMCKHPDMQKRLRSELRDAGIVSPLSPDASQTVAAADLDKLPYLAAVCNEVLRVNAPVALTLRHVPHQTTILDHVIPKGTTVVLSPAVINSSKDLWGEDADEFKPERWLAPGEANRGGASSNYAFMTFIHGPRSCIGSGFARAEFMCLLAAWITAFETELEDPDRKIVIRSAVTIRPVDGLRVKLSPILS